MARKKIREFAAKGLIVKNATSDSFSIEHKSVLITPETDIFSLPQEHPWLLNTQLVIKPDQLFGKRRKLGLVAINISFEEAKQWLQEHRNKEVTIGKATDTLTHFLIEPCIPHEQEYYLAFTSKRDYDVIHFSEQGGINIEENWDQVKTMKVPTLEHLNDTEQLTNNLTIQEFIKTLFLTYRNLDFTYLEVNPFTVKDNIIYLLDTVAHVDDCASFKNMNLWGKLEFPKEFGKKQFPEERHIEEIDRNSGASLKLTVLNPKGRIWTILAGGGASIIYLDMITNLGKGQEVANYGDLAGGPTTAESYEYAKTVFELMIKEKDPRGKVLFILGCIANFTDVKETFKGFILALEEFQYKLKEHNVKIFIRRGGPNYKEGIALIKETGKRLQLPMLVHGPETSMEKIIEIAGGYL